MICNSFLPINYCFLFWCRFQNTCLFCLVIQLDKSLYNFCKTSFLTRLTFANVSISFSFLSTNVLANHFQASIESFLCGKCTQFFSSTFLSSWAWPLSKRLILQQVQHYIFVVQAQDTGRPSLSSTLTVYFNVLDLNDNAPLFDPMSYSNEVFENVPLSTSVVTVSATDLDSGKNNNFFFCTFSTVSSKTISMYIGKNPILVDNCLILSKSTYCRNLLVHKKWSTCSRFC